MNSEGTNDLFISSNNQLYFYIKKLYNSLGKIHLKPLGDMANP